jgi:hypothetical protein
VIKIMRRKENDIPIPNCMVYWFPKEKETEEYFS